MFSDRQKALGWLVIGLLAGCAAPQPRSPFAGDGQRPLLLAHRGISQTFDAQGVDKDTCTATRMHPPTHPYLENTLPSMRAALKAGADVFEVDIHPTSDGDFAVFHDWGLECRTDGSGVTRSHTLAYLQDLDIGYGYTADGGKSYPFRGKGVGMMPSLGEVLQAFSHELILINVKSDDPLEGEQLAAYLAKLSPERRSRLAVYGGDRPIAAVKQRLPGMLTLSQESLKACLIGYKLFSWSGQIPASCEKQLLLVPLNFGYELPGWPDAFVASMTAVGSAVFALGNYAGGPSTGIDSLAQLKALPQGYRGGIWTNEISLIGAALRQQGK